MAGERVNRKLAAILAADVVGYSRLMAADEAGTLAALKRHRETVFDPAVAAHNGPVVKLIGDGTIVEFASVVDAVNCALSVQRSGAPAPDHRAAAIVLRIGINLGDVGMARWRPLFCLNDAGLLQGTHLVTLGNQLARKISLVWRRGTGRRNEFQVFAKSSESAVKQSQPGNVIAQCRLMAQTARDSHEPDTRGDCTAGSEPIAAAYTELNLGISRGRCVLKSSGLLASDDVLTTT
jgi:hypothetical protein